MKISRFPLAAVLVAVGLLGGTSAFAAESTNVEVSATVTGICKFASKTAAVNFGSLDATATGTITSTDLTHPTFWCTKGSTVTVALGNGSNHDATDGRRMKHGTSADYIPYTLTATPSGTVGQGASTPLTINLSASLAAAKLADVPAGAYGDSVVLSITP